MQGSSAQAQIEEQRAANRSAIEHFGAFAAHREKLTALLRAASPADGGRLCVLGAGNCYDLDLAELGRVYAEIHLVDLDRTALERACERQEPALRARLFRHAPVDLSGTLERLDAWKSMNTTPAEIAAWPGATARQIAETLPGPFDVVVSACVLSQLHFSVLNVLSDRHQLFEAVRQLLNLAHLRTLARLITASGKALLVNDLASDEMIAESAVDTSLPPLSLALSLARKGQVIHAVHPDFLAWSVSEDPMLNRGVVLDPPSDAWFWRVGPDRSFLVCAQLLTRRP